MPTFMLFKDGNKADELVGAVPAKLNVCRTCSLLLHETDKFFFQELVQAAVKLTA